MGLRGALVSISILALVHLGTSTTMWKVSEPAARGMSWNGEMGPVDSVDSVDSGKIDVGNRMSQYTPSLSLTKTL